MSSSQPSPSRSSAPDPGVGGRGQTGRGRLSAIPTSPSVKRLRADRARQVADVLRQQVVRAAFPGGVLPDERALVVEFSTTRNTVRAALDILRGEGLIDRIPGIGTVAKHEKYPHGLNRLMGLAETLHEHGEVTNEVRTAGPMRPPGVVARRLHLQDDADVVYVERLRHLDGLPLSLDLTYLTMDVGEPLLSEDLARRDIFGLIEQTTRQRLGIAEITIEAISADAHSAALLDVPKGAALLVVERLSHLEDGRPVDLEFIRFRGDRITMRGELWRDGDER